MFLRSFLTLGRIFPVYFAVLNPLGQRTGIAWEHPSREHSPFAIWVLSSGFVHVVATWIEVTWETTTSLRTYAVRDILFAYWDTRICKQSDENTHDAARASRRRFHCMGQQRHLADTRGKKICRHDSGHCNARPPRLSKPSTPLLVRFNVTKREGETRWEVTFF